MEAVKQIPWWQQLVTLGAQTGSQIALGRWGNSPTYQQTQTPYGSSTTVYGGTLPLPGQSGSIPSPQQLVQGVGNTSMVLIIGGLAVVALMMMSGRK